MNKMNRLHKTSQTKRILLGIAGTLVALYMAYATSATVHSLLYSSQLDVFSQTGESPDKTWSIAHFTAVQTGSQFLPIPIPNLFETEVYSKGYMQDASELSRANNYGYYFNVYTNPGTKITCQVMQQEDVTVFHYTGVGVRANGQQDSIDEVVICKFFSDISLT